MICLRRDPPFIKGKELLLNPKDSANTIPLEAQAIILVLKIFFFHRQFCSLPNVAMDLLLQLYILFPSCHSA
jgi:hypothetical protein